MGEVVVDHARSTVMVPTGTAIDPGGIGKGLAADRGVLALLAGGATGALVGIGGDLAMGGEPPVADGWLVRIEHADQAAGELCRVAVSGGGVATSSVRSRRWFVDGQEHHHLIDPSTGHEAETDLASVTVFAATGWWAEASATAALLADRAEVVRYLESQQLSGLAIAANGSVLRTHDLADIELNDPVPAR